MRALWQGFLKLSLVSCAVELHSLVRQSERISFNTINRKTGNRVRRLYVDAETGADVPPEDQVKGYEVAESDYVLLEDDELDAVALEATRVIDLHSFCRPEEIDPLYFDMPYALVPEPGAGEDAFALIRDAMDASGMAGLGSIVLHRRERPVLLQPRSGVMVMTALRFNYEVRDLQKIAANVEQKSADPELVALASHIMQTRAVAFAPETFTDRYEEALISLIKAKEAGRTLPQAPLALPPNVINLYEALRQSLAAVGGGGGGGSGGGGSGGGGSRGPGRPRMPRGATGRAPAAPATPAPARRRAGGRKS